MCKQIGQFNGNIFNEITVKFIFICLLLAEYAKKLFMVNFQLIDKLDLILILLPTLLGNLFSKKDSLIHKRIGTKMHVSKGLYLYYIKSP